MTAFVAGLLILPPTPKWHEAEAILSAGAAAVGSEDELAAELHEQLLSDDALRETLKRLGPPAGLEATSAANWPPYSEIERMRSLVRIAPARDAGDGHIRIGVFDAHDARALALLQRLAASAAGDSTTSAPPGAALSPAINQQLEMLRAAERQARAKLDAFIEQQSPDEGAASPATGAPAVDVPAIDVPAIDVPAVDAGQSAWFGGASASAGEVQLASGEVEVCAGFAKSGPRQIDNPEWLALKSDLDAQTSERHRLLRQLTPLHPQVQAIEAEIDEIRQRLLVTPRYTDPEPTQPTEPTEPTQPTQPNPSGAAGAGRATDVEGSGANSAPTPSPAAGRTAQRAAEYESLLRAYDEARSRLTEAETLAKQIAAGGNGLADEARVRIVAPPRIVRSEGGEPSRLGVIVLAIFALGAGVAAALACRGAAVAISTFASAADVGRELALPLVGEIRRGGAIATAPRGGLRRSVAARAVRVAELLLLVFLAAFVLVATIDSPFIGQTLQSPLSAASRIMQRLTELI